MKKITPGKILFLASQCLLITAIIMSVGYFYNKKIPEKYFITYETEIDDKAKIYLGTIDRLLIKLNLIRRNDAKIVTTILDKLTNLGNTIRNKPEHILSLSVYESNIKFHTKNKDNLDKDVNKIISLVNEYLRNDIEDMLSLYYSYAIQYINEEIQYTLSQLDRMSNLSDEIKNEGLGDSATQEKYFLEEFVNKVFNQNAQGLSATELLDVFNTFNITKNLENIEYLREVYLNTKPSDNIDLVRMKRLSQELKNVNFVSEKYLVGVINLKPSMTHTLLASMLLGLFVSITYIYLYLLNAKKPILKSIKALRNLV